MKLCFQLYSLLHSEFNETVCNGFTCDTPSSEIWGVWTNCKGNIAEFNNQVTENVRDTFRSWSIGIANARGVSFAVQHYGVKPADKVKMNVNIPRFDRKTQQMSLEKSYQLHKQRTAPTPQKAVVQAKANNPLFSVASRRSGGRH